ncbi:Protein RRP5 homolog [Eumeta japonica]|uniref:Protein RRP5 homolog n=1 Tax=Eumeta variegata TaxID=151549 RepID=A0A4C1V241_EUMVA|nr:Protein RRP5 homolog [Eumeta japonica]
MKPSFLSPDLEIVKEYQDLKVGQSYKGFIKHIKQDFILVNFFNNISALIPKKFISTQPVEDVREVFHIGQIVNCTIVKINPEEKKLIGSFITEPFDVSTRHKKKDFKRKHESNSEIDININSTEPQKKRKKREAETCGSIQLPNVMEVKKQKKSGNAIAVSEESDAIKTDIHEKEEEIVVRQPPHDDLQLLDFSNCISQKNYKKRIVSLLKATNKRNQRIAAIEEKICSIEEDGLTINNKKIHTALHAEKILLEERLQLLMEALQKAQQKFNEFPPLEPVDYKRKKKESTETNETEINKPLDVKKNKKEENSEPNLNEILKLKSKEIKVAVETTPVVEVPSAKDFWSLNLDTGFNNLNDKQEDSSSSDEEVKDQTKKKRKKLTAAEKVAKARAEEEKLRELEKRAIEGDAHPRSVDQFERALLANPNSSELWIAYMAFHLQATEIEKARTVGRKALKTISFREEQEKLNVWLAMLNFENRFGTKESQQQTLEEALQMNDTFKIHSKLLDIYVETSKISELTALVDLMMRKYKKDPNTYVLTGNACYKLGLIDKARAVMQKAISVLDKKEHVSVIVQFALSERAHGSPERSEALFEQILGVYPQRVDVCAVYVDALFKSNDIDNIRQVMERMTSLKLPARKMKTLYKKWIEIEEKIGDTEQIERIRQKALEFIEKAQF